METPRPCPKCKKPMERRPRMFFLMEFGHFHGYVCDPCNVLCVDPEDSFIEAASSRVRPGSDPRINGGMEDGDGEL